MAWERDLNTGIYLPEPIQFAQRLAKAQAERVDRGRFFSSYAWTQNAANNGYTKPHDSVPFALLRDARDKSLIDGIIILARQQQMRMTSKRVVSPGKELGLRVVHENHADPNYKPDNDTIRRCKEMEKIIENVNTDIHPNGFMDFGPLAVEYELVYDRKCIVIARDRTGMPIKYHMIDGTTVRPVLDYLLDYQKENKLRGDMSNALEHVYRASGVDLTGAAYVQVVDGMPVAAWTKDDMSIHITNPSVEINRWAYGRGSILEQSIRATMTWLNAWSYNDGLFNQDSPEQMLFLYGDYDPVGLSAFKRQVLDQSGSGDYQKIPIIPADKDFKVEMVRIRELPKDVQFAEFLRIIIQLKTAAYRAHPSLVNFTIDQGTGGPKMGNTSEDELVKDAKEEGFQTICHNLASWLTRIIIKPRYDDLVMIFETDLEDEQGRIELIGNQLEKGGMSFNEARRAQGLTGDLPFGDITNSTVYATYAQSQQQMKMDQQQAKQAQQEGKTQQAQASMDKTGQMVQSSQDHANAKELKQMDFEHQSNIKQMDVDHQTNIKQMDHANAQKLMQYKTATGTEGAGRAKSGGRNKTGNIQNPQKVRSNLGKSVQYQYYDGRDKVLILEIEDDD